MRLRVEKGDILGWTPYQQVFPGQPKRHEDGSEWEVLFHMKIAEYLHQVFIYYVSGGQVVNIYIVLSNSSYVS